MSKQPKREKRQPLVQQTPIIQDSPLHRLLRMIAREIAIELEDRHSRRIDHH